VTRFGGRRRRVLRDTIGVFVLGRLDTEDRAVLQAHLEDCPSCRSEVELLTPVVELLSRVDPQLIDRV
jgi:anti-sigma factor RsiW